jgi:hypothetical protein
MRDADAYQASFADGVPYTLLPGGATSRSATSSCTMTRPDVMLGNVASRWRITGTEMLYGRLATTRVGGGSSSVMRSASASTTVSRSAASGSRSETVRASRVASDDSISTAVTCAPASSRPSVSDPSPGPTSSTTSPGWTPASATIRRTVLGSMTKFWPRCLLGRRSSSAASVRIVLGIEQTGRAVSHRRPTTRRTPRTCWR